MIFAELSGWLCCIHTAYDEIARRSKIVYWNLLQKIKTFRHFLAHSAHTAKQTQKHCGHEWCRVMVLFLAPNEAQALKCISSMP